MFDLSKMNFITNTRYSFVGIKRNSAPDKQLDFFLPHGFEVFKAKAEEGTEDAFDMVKNFFFKMYRTFKKFQRENSIEEIHLDNKRDGFHEKEGGSIVRQGIDWTKVKSFSIGNRSFITGRRKGIRSGGELDVKVLEILKQTDRMTLFMRHPYSRKDMGMNISFRGDYHIQKAGDELQNLNSVSYNVNFKKKFSKYVADCPQLSERVLNGEFKVKKEDLVRIVDAYNTCQ